jgi:cytochrome P450
MNVPIFNPDLASMWQDPYPELKRLRAEAPIVRAAYDNSYVLTRYDDIVSCLMKPEIFSSDQYDGVTAIQGRGFMRMDGAEQKALRRAVQPTFSPKSAKSFWTERFAKLTEDVLDRIEPQREADWIKELAMPIAGEALKLITGITQVSWQEMDSLSQTMIDGVANVEQNKEVWQRCEASTAAIDRYIDEIIPQVKAQPDHSLISSMVNSGQSLEQIRADLKITIGGGQNEPRDVLSGATDTLLSNPEQLQRVKNGDATWHNVFDEYARLVAPIGVVTRVVKQAHEMHGLQLKENDLLVLFLSSANRDESVFENPEHFDVTRDSRKHVAFSKGTHFCAGAHVSRSLIADVALPMIFERFKNLRLLEKTVYGGWFFRGPIKMRVAWD